METLGLPTNQQNCESATSEGKRSENSPSQNRRARCRFAALLTLSSEGGERVAMHAEAATGLAGHRRNAASERRCYSFLTEKGFPVSGRNCDILKTRANYEKKFI